MAEKPTLHFFCGKLVSGKTTLARQLANQVIGVLVCEALDADLLRGSTSE